MNYVRDFFITNYILLCVSFVLIVTMIRKIKTQKRISIFLILIVSLTVLIAVLDTLKNYIQYEKADLFLTTFLAALLYVLRPCCILLFIFLCGQKFKHPLSYVLLGLTGINIIVNVLALIPATRELGFYFVYGDDGVIHWTAGPVLIFRYTPHIISILYLVFLVYKSILLLRAKHLFDAIGVLVCALVVSVATIIETFFNNDNTVYLLPSSIAISTVFYYLFLYERQNKLDVLTDLFNRASYFDDLVKLKSDITGVIQLDMNGLKYLNDNYGHHEGDNGLKRIAKAITDHATRKMYAYRLGGDEFVVLAINESEDNILKFVSAFKEDIKTTKYYCSIGYASLADQTKDASELFKLSEQRMYEDKARFYEKATFERRQSHYIDK